MEWLEKISTNGKVVFLLSLLNLIVEKLSDSTAYDIAKEAIEAGWNWVYYKNVSADELYYYLENVDEDDILSCLLLEKGSEIEDVLICIADACAYIIYLAYKNENAVYLPETIEGVDNATLMEFIDTYTRAFEFGNIVNDIQYFFTTNFSQNQQEIVCKEIIDNYIHTEFSKYNKSVDDSVKYFV